MQTRKLLLQAKRNDSADFFQPEFHLHLGEREIEFAEMYVIVFYIPV